MKTRKLDKKILHDIAYGYDGDGYVSSEMWIDSHVDVFFKSDVSRCTFVIRRDSSEFVVDARNYRQHTWYNLFHSISARFVLQDLYDFLYC